METVTIVILALLSVVIVARRMPLIGEGAIAGLLFLAVEGYHFYLEPTLNVTPIPPNMLLFVGVYIVTSALLMLGRLYNPTKKYVTMVTGK